MEEIGKITSRTISEKEFSYKWEFCRVLDYNTYRSPTFGTFYYEFSDCYLETICHSTALGIAMIFYLKGCDAPSSILCTISLMAYIDGRLHGLTLPQSEKEISLKSSTKIFEALLSRHEVRVYERFIFNFQVKLHKDFTIRPKAPSLHQENENHNKSSSAPVKAESKNKPYVDNPKELIQDLKTFYSSGNMCDLEIRIGESILRAHKFMLCARSPIFMKMMEHNCLESSSNSITITDCSAIPFQKFLMYLYTGEIEDRSMDTVMPLYSLGDKYDVPALRNACSDILQNKISESVDDVANIICDVLKLADFHNDVKLRDLAASFIVNNFPVVSNKQSWKDLMSNDFKLTSEVLALVVTACQKLKT